MQFTHCPLGGGPLPRGPRPRPWKCPGAHGHSQGHLNPGQGFEQPCDPKCETRMTRHIPLTTCTTAQSSPLCHFLPKVLKMCGQGRGQGGPKGQGQFLLLVRTCPLHMDHALSTAKGQGTLPGSSPERLHPQAVPDHLPEPGVSA